MEALFGIPGSFWVSVTMRPGHHERCPQHWAFQKQFCELIRNNGSRWKRNHIQPTPLLQSECAAQESTAVGRDLERARASSSPFLLFPGTEAKRYRVVAKIVRISDQVAGTSCRRVCAARVLSKFVQSSWFLKIARRTALFTPNQVQ